MQNDLYSAADSRALAMRLRPDLTIVRQTSLGATYFIIKDELAQRYWQFSPEESLILENLDGKTSSKEVCASFHRAFAPRRLKHVELVAFLGRLHGEGLLQTDRPGQTEVILERRNGQVWHRQLRAMRMLLWWRFRGIDPQRWLAPLARRCKGAFSRTAAALYAMLVISALTIVIARWPMVDRELAGLAQSFAADDAIVILALTAAVKVLHELAHGVACQHFGGRCHEMGLLVFLGAPALYCNVSDAWLLPDKWSRILISAAGILAETALAAACCWIWLASEPGWLHSSALYLMVVCSANTILLNGNPLLQFDGYHILADWTNTPNLRAASSAAVRRLIARAVLGLRLGPTGYLEGVGRRWLVGYGVASLVYRCLVVLAAFWFMRGVLARFQLQSIAWILAGLLLCAFVTEPCLALARFLGRPGNIGAVPWRWVAPRTAVICALGMAAISTPIPCHVVCPVVLEPRGARTVYVEVEGRLQWAVAAGARVKEGDLIARLENQPLAAKVARLQGDLAVKRLRLENLRRTQADPTAAVLIPTAEKSLSDAQQQLRQLAGDYERLAIRAPRAGVVLPPQDVAEDRERAWENTPLDPTNLGCHLRTGDAICMIAEPSEVDAVVFVGPRQADLIASGQSAQVVLNCWPQCRLDGKVSAGPATRVEKIPDELVQRGEIAPEGASPRGQANPPRAFYASRISLEPLDQAVLAAATGRAKVTVASMSLTRRGWRSLRQTFAAW